jgi:hypothetical protein
LFEYTQLTAEDIEGGTPYRVLDELYGAEDINDDELEINVDQEKFPTLWLACECVSVIRHFAYMYSHSDTSVLPFYAALFSFAIKSTSFRDTSLEQKKFAMYACRLYGKKIRSIVLGEGPAGNRKKSRLKMQRMITKSDSGRNSMRADAKRLMHSVKRYCVQTEIYQCSIVDAVSRDTVAAEDCVSMDFVEGDSLKDIERREQDVRSRSVAARVHEPGDILEIAKANDIVILLGEAASGKSTYMRKILKAAVNRMQRQFQAKTDAARRRGSISSVSTGSSGRSSVGGSSRRELGARTASTRSSRLGSTSGSTSGKIGGTAEADEAPDGGAAYEQPIVVIFASAMEIANALRKDSIQDRGKGEYACPHADPENESTGSLLDAWLLHKYNSKRDPRYKMLASQLKDNTVGKLLMIDGLDEAGDQKDAIALSLASKHRFLDAGIKILISSRVSGYNDQAFKVSALLTDSIDSLDMASGLHMCQLIEIYTITDCCLALSALGSCLQGARLPQDHEALQPIPGEAE